MIHHHNSLNKDGEDFDDTNEKQQNNNNNNNNASREVYDIKLNGIHLWNIQDSMEVHNIIIIGVGNFKQDEFTHNRICT